MHEESKLKGKKKAKKQQSWKSMFILMLFCTNSLFSQIQFILRNNCLLEISFLL